MSYVYTKLTKNKLLRYLLNLLSQLMTFLLQMRGIHINLLLQLPLLR